MPIPLQGLVPVAEYGSKFEADVAANLLVDNGIRATTSYDPALNSVATYFASDRTVEVLVRAEDAGGAVEILEQADEGLPDSFTSPDVAGWPGGSTAGRDTRRHVTRVVAVGLLILFVVPLVFSLFAVFRT
jgi:hypothetical protein